MGSDDERRLTITIVPRPSDDGLLKVNDALQQVLDFLKVVEAAGRSLSSDPQRAFDWKLESASTNSPFTVVAVAEARNPSVDVSKPAAEAKRATALAFRQIHARRVAPAWLDQDARVALRSVYQRNLNGVASTRVGRAQDADFIEVTHETAALDVESLKALAPLAAPMDIPARQIVGELAGHLLGVGRYRGHPALTILSAQYGRVVCTVADTLVAKLGGEKTLEDVWTGRSVAVSGTLFFGVGGVLNRVVADEIRDRVAAPVSLSLILDGEFTSGLEPTDYLDGLHGGYLA